MAIVTTGLQTMAGLAAIVLGILALSGFAPTKLVLIALLELGCFSSPTSAVVRGSLARAFRLAPHAEARDARRPLIELRQALPAKPAADAGEATIGDLAVEAGGGFPNPPGGSL